MATESKDYYLQNIGQVWTFPEYRAYEKGRWTWQDLPFSDDLARRQYLPQKLTKRIAGKSILEVGSAMGRAYEFMKTSGLVDVSKYAGIEVSDMGYERSSQIFPEARWIHADFTRYEIDTKYDFVFERVAVHHMPEPLAQFRKMLSATNIAMMTTFRGCVRGKTVSDLSKGFFRTRDDKYFCNIINVFELVNLALDQGFRHVRVEFLGLHEPISSDPSGYQYLDPEISNEGRLISRFRVRFSRLPNGAPIQMYVTTPPARFLITQFAVVRTIHRTLAEIASMRNT
jgi:SAM-dependent methyltransferase